VKQQCESKQFIAINNKLKVDARVFISNGRNGEETKTAERQREGKCERQSIAGRAG
jgi:hypothetical protein